VAFVARSGGDAVVPLHVLQFLRIAGHATFPAEMHAAILARIQPYYLVDYSITILFSTPSSATFGSCNSKKMS
jgi:hypothetical protein